MSALGIFGGVSQQHAVNNPGSMSTMNPADTKKALLTAQRAYERALRAKSCAIATTNFRHGEQQAQRGHAAVRELIPAKTEWRHYSPVQRELVALDDQLPHLAYNAHLHRLEQCGVTEMTHMRRAAEDRARSEGAADRSRERQYRKRPKKNTR